MPASQFTKYNSCLVSYIIIITPQQIDPQKTGSSSSQTFDIGMDSFMCHEWFRVTDRVKNMSHRQTNTHQFTQIGKQPI